MASSEKFGRCIRELRKQRGLSQQQLADDLYVTRATVANWESGNRIPDIVMLSQLAKALGVETQELLEEFVSPDSPPVVIVVDDERVILQGFVHMLENTLPGVDVYGFYKAAEALRFAENSRIDIAFLDIELRGESGVDLARSIMALWPRVNIIFVTSHSEFTGEAIDLRCSGYLMKPLTSEKIRTEIEHLRYSVRGLRENAGPEDRRQINEN